MDSLGILGKRSEEERSLIPKIHIFSRVNSDSIYRKVVISRYKLLPLVAAPPPRASSCLNCENRACAADKRALRAAVAGLSGDASC